MDGGPQVQAGLPQDEEDADAAGRPVGLQPRHSGGQEGGCAPAAAGEAVADARHGPIPLRPALAGAHRG